MVISRRALPRTPKVTGGLCRLRLWQDHWQFSKPTGRCNGLSRTRTATLAGTGLPCRMYEAPAPNLRSLTPVYLALHIVGGHMALPILVFIYLVSKKVRAHRHPTVVNFCVTWIIYSVTYCLLAYGGNNYDEIPPERLCIVQAAMIYGAPSMAVVAGLILVLYLWDTFHGHWKFLNVSKIPYSVQLIMIISPPYIVFFSFFASAAYLGITQPEKVSAENGLYCTLRTGDFRPYVGPVFCGTVMMIIMVFQLTILVRYCIGLRRMKHLFPLADVKRPSLSPWIRAIIFMFYSWVTFGACMSFLMDYPTAFPYISQAALPLVAFLVFGTHKDVFLVLCCRREKKKWETDSISDTHSGGTRSTSPVDPTSFDAMDQLSPILAPVPAMEQRIAAAV
ncbi:hypothetical protein SCP_0106150 [Sparassis crispa]|uniref:G-protein coupled receptors family 1 profile domain-containing protein n=1 Tax=Sparassis crispa TaxID=139825 RepID=A0A401G6E4_9APHY|nr:hypothetical protein SCP_0106150 [Sparassis crispa]GBE77733.1 hypothetical protein SCP_0106150 [Sparassis crispa]